MCESICHIGPAQGNDPARKRKTRNQRRRERQGNAGDHWEGDFWEYEHEIMGLREVAAQVIWETTRLKDYVSNQVDMVPYFAPPPHQSSDPTPGRAAPL